MQTINNDKFFEQFKPIRNPLYDNASFEGCMLETFGPELQFVLKTAQAAPNTVWTVLDCDGELVITSGYHYVNRLGYLITEKPFTGEVTVSEGGDFEPDGSMACTEEI